MEMNHLYTATAVSVFEIVFIKSLFCQSVSLRCRLAFEFGVPESMLVFWKLSIRLGFVLFFRFRMYLRCQAQSVASCLSVQSSEITKS